MKTNLRHWVAAAVISAAAFAFSSCAYDPYYYGGSAGYSGYGYGYGYGGSNFSTSFFVSTGDPRWGYDPYCYSYYDYYRHCYYDPYLNGYYPVGYRPAIVVGVPHPYGWRPGHGHIAPPRTVRSVTVVNYHDRAAAYRNTNYSWAGRVHQQSAPQVHSQGQRPSRSTYGSPSASSHSSSTFGNAGTYSSSRSQTQYETHNRPSHGGNSYATPSTSVQSNARASSAYGNPSTSSSSYGRSSYGHRGTGYSSQAQSLPQTSTAPQNPYQHGARGASAPAQPQPGNQRGGNSSRRGGKPNSSDSGQGDSQGPRK